MRRGCAAGSGRITNRRGRFFQFPTNHRVHGDLRAIAIRMYYRKFKKTRRSSTESLSILASARGNIARSWYDLWIYLYRKIENLLLTRSKYIPRGAYVCAYRVIIDLPWNGTRVTYWLIARGSAILKLSHSNFSM